MVIQSKVRCLLTRDHRQRVTRRSSAWNDPPVVVHGDALFRLLQALIGWRASEILMLDYSPGRVGRGVPSARTEPVRRLAPAAASGVATSSSDLPSASTARNQATSPPTIITPAPSK